MLVVFTYLVKSRKFFKGIQATFLATNGFAEAEAKKKDDTTS